MAIDEILALVSDLILELDASLRIGRARGGLLAQLGHAPEALAGLPLAELIAPGSRASFEAYAEKRREAPAGELRPPDLRLLRADGADLPAELALHALGGAGDPSWVAIARDTSDRRRLRAEQDRAEALEEANSALRGAMLHAEQTTRIKTEFLANVSHEIRTPMTAILGFTELLIEEATRGNAPRVTVDALRTIQRNGDYLLTLLNDILDLSKIESGRLEVERVRFSPIAVVQDVERLMRVRAEAKAIAFRVEFAPDLPAQIEGDPTRVRQILINLVGNAIKFTEMGEVRLCVHLREEREHARILFDVIDTGIGITPAERARLFRPFRQADGSTTRRYGGTGLGLTISKHLCELLDGTIEVESEPGRGTTFRVDLPTGNLRGVARIAAQRELGEAARADHNGAMPQLSGTVLLVEDGQDNQRLISLLLAKLGLDVVVAENGQQAIERFHEAREAGGRFALVLMDMQMPVMDGYTATRLLRRHGFSGPIVALTAHAMDTERGRCLAAGCDDFATKPISRERFFELMAAHLGAGKDHGDG